MVTITHRLIVNGKKQKPVYKDLGAVKAAAAEIEKEMTDRPLFWMSYKAYGKTNNYRIHTERKL